jgi:hypothetical protein
MVRHLRHARTRRRDRRTALRACLRDPGPLAHPNNRCQKPFDFLEVSSFKSPLIPALTFIKTYPILVL